MDAQVREPEDLKVCMAFRDVGEHRHGSNVGDLVRCTHRQWMVRPREHCPRHARMSVPLVVAGGQQQPFSKSLVDSPQQ
jgi:hypothetical protein